MKTNILLGLLCAFSPLLLTVKAGAQHQEPSNLPDEYLKNLKNYEFVNTRGMKDLVPNRHSWLLPKYDDSDNWELPTEDEIKTLKELGITFPDFSFITGSDTVAPGQRRQRTHTIEHLLYALPGDALSLYPYYGLEEMQINRADGTTIESTKGFLETFSHWYDYRNGGRVVHESADGRKYDLLDFPSCREFIQLTDDYGFYGGIYMSPGSRVNHVLEVRYVATPQQYIDAVNAINTSGGSGSIVLTADLDFSGIGNVPMLGDYNGGHFSGIIDGNGHKISNLKIEKDYPEIGLVRYAASGARIYNLTIESSCSFQGTYIVGLIAKFDGGALKVSNVIMNGSVKGTREGSEDHCTGAILGNCDNTDTDNILTFENLYIGSTIGNSTMDDGAKHNTVLCGWLETNATRSTSRFTNIIFNGTLYGGENLKGARYIRRVTHQKFSWDNCSREGNSFVEKHDDYSIIYTDCYGNIDNVDPAWTTFTEIPAIDSWESTANPGTIEVKIPTEENLGGALLANSSHRPWRNEDQDRRKAGTSAVFYFPDNGSLGSEFLNDRSEYVIAADFSQTFEPRSHLDTEAMTVKEPLVAFRHIFRIRDGRLQAKELKKNNREYIRRHQHKVSARVGANFQIRLDFPLPTDWGTTGGVTNYYYENEDGSYSRVKQFGLRVLDGDTRKKKYDLGNGLPDNDDRFELGANIRMRRAEAASNKEHAQAIEKMFEYHSMLMKPRVDAEAHYIVQVIAKDDAGNFIPASDGDMVLMEYDITFLPEKGASLLTEERLYSEDNKFLHARDEYMKKEYGMPVDYIDFDNYFAINRMPGNDALKKKMISYSVVKHTEADGLYKDFPVWDRYSDFQGSDGKMYHSFYKWPISWNRSGYSFGYNYRYDYNMYMLTTHSENVPYHAKADEWNNNIGSENGLYDRLYYKTKRLKEADPRVNIEQGYFYYVNAASDPGVSARLNFDIPCPGSRVIVSAWVAEMSPADAFQDEPANLSFNFVAVMNGTNERITLHNFITGYIGEKNLYTGNLDEGSQLGKWLNIYYSFVPRLADFSDGLLSFDDVDHFELELAHNGRSSAGSDYAIDDIRAYVVPPYCDAGHEGFACEDTSLDIIIENSFETLLEKSGHPEAFDETGEELSLYFAFVDKEIVEEEGDLQNAFITTFMKNDKGIAYGTVNFNSNYLNNNPYLKAVEDHELKYDKGYRFSGENGDRIIKFHTTVAPGSLRPGKEYYVVFTLSDPDISTESDLATDFDLMGECSYKCEMTVIPSLKIKLDGIIQPEFDNISVCENQSPVIQVNVWSTDKNPVEVMKNAYFDWFDGSINDFLNYRFKDYPASKEIIMDDVASEGEKTLSHALNIFRTRHSDAETTTGISPESPGSGDEDVLEEWMLDIIDIATAPDPSGKTRLLLHQSSFVLPPVNLPANAPEATAKVVAIPIVDLYPGGDYESVCPSPTEIGVNISNRTPILLHGLTGITYPDYLTDVPLRVGLSQLTKGDGSSLLFSKNTLDMPVRIAASSDGKERAFSLVKEKTMIDGREETRSGCLLLAQTNDPEYRNLGTVNDNNEETGYLLWVGEIKELSAGGNNSDTRGREYFLADFDDDFKFKEGYYYRMRFRFEEKDDENIDADDGVVCKGQDVFTIKIVPEYMQWTGDKNLSWDNDDNWRRVASSEILKDDAPVGNALFTDGGSANSRAYAPLSFTKVVIDKTAMNDDGEMTGENPWLYDPKGKTEVNDDYTPSLKNPWTSDPACGNPTDNMSRVGSPSALIQYDMTGYVDGLNTSVMLRCRPWTANHCSEIHFLTGATLMGQQYLNYSRAWVDIELDHSRWYLLSTPLRDVYAGDFYLPTANARQGTELFKEINFDKNLNNRFAPAVYQRGWDKGQANVYEFGKSGARNAAVKTFWSHVYNDVEERYGEGNAFSIKTDVSKVTAPDDKVLFRLPKADSKYLYYSADGKQTGHETKLNKDNSYRLNAVKGTLTGTTANAGRYFLVGNPFMTYFDIREFLKENTDKLTQKYWLITQNGQIAGSISDSGTFVASPYPSEDTPADPTVIAPMQGFFVESREDAETIELTYNESMMRRYDSAGGVLTEGTRGESPALRIYSLNDGRPSSAALLLTGEPDEDVCTDAFDLRDLGVSSIVFTAHDGHARAINCCKDPAGTEIGVIADDETETTVVFDGTENFAELMLLDREDNSVTPLTDLKEIKVKGTISGRFFLISEMEDSPLSDSLHYTVDGTTLNIVDLAATGSLSVTVCDITGRVVAEAHSGTDSLSVRLDKGIFVIRIANANEKKNLKLSL